MDRISALRNVEDALRDFEAGEADLASTERQVLAVLRTYATEFEGDDGRVPYVVSGDDPADGLVVVAASRRAARERVVELVADADGEVAFEVAALD